MEEVELGKRGSTRRKRMVNIADRVGPKRELTVDNRNKGGSHGRADGSTAGLFLKKKRAKRFAKKGSMARRSGKKKDPQKTKATDGTEAGVEGGGEEKRNGNGDYLYEGDPPYKWRYLLGESLHGRKLNLQ